MKQIFFVAVAFTLSLATLQAEIDHSQSKSSTLPEEPKKLFQPVDQTDIFAIQLDSDEVEEDEELNDMEQMQKNYEKKSTKAQEEKNHL